jgi:3',5'-cyclic AMP phosphodiesterase CpdA
VKLAWATDIHLNFIGADEVEAFAHTIAARAPDALLVSGDIAEAPSLADGLLALARVLARPIYFVLGNHDFYYGGIAEVRAQAAALGQRSPWLRWLPRAGVVPLAPGTALVGHDGWGDGRLGSGARSRVMLNDFIAIRDLMGLTDQQRFARLAALGDEAAHHLRATLPAALETHAHALVLTHVPPFTEACWHEGRTSGEDWLPFFTCKAVGDVLLEIAAARPDRRVTVLCGHTHGSGRARLLPNLEVLTGGAEYGAPALQDDIVID